VTIKAGVAAPHLRPPSEFVSQAATEVEATRVSLKLQLTCMFAAR
jgi:hypothetical protein